MKGVLLTLPLFLSSGCGVMLGSTIYGDMQYDKQVKAGKAPPMPLVRECQWGTSGQEQIQCFRDHGWRYDVGAGWTRLAEP